MKLFLEGRWQAILTALREQFERAVQDGDLPAGTDCATLARYTATVLNGLQGCCSAAEQVFDHGIAVRHLRRSCHYSDHTRDSFDRPLSALRPSERSSQIEKGLSADHEPAEGAVFAQRA
jgi:hypothetical protein